MPRQQLGWDGKLVLLYCCLQLEPPLIIVLHCALHHPGLPSVHINVRYYCPLWMRHPLRPLTTSSQSQFYATTTALATVLPTKRKKKWRIMLDWWEAPNFVYLCLWPLLGLHFKFFTEKDMSLGGLVGAGCSCFFSLISERQLGKLLEAVFSCTTFVKTD